MRKSSSSTKDEESNEQLLQFFQLRGKYPLELARKIVLEEASKLDSAQVKEALKYFILDYWQDLARPTLLSVCCEAVGGNPKVTIPFAVSLSILSGGIDIHDDIIDRSKRKHGRSTVYGKYGKEIALLTADALLFKGFTLLNEASAKIPKTKAQKILKTIEHLFYELGDAEALELKLRGRWGITPEEYLHIVRKKAADVEAHAQIGAILGNATAKEEKNLANYGRLLGMSIIIRDDILDSLDIKELKHRIVKEHIPLPLVYALGNGKSVHYSAPPNILFKEFSGEKIEAGIKKCNNLLRELINEACVYIKNLNEYGDLKLILEACTEL